MCIYTNILEFLGNLPICIYKGILRKNMFIQSDKFLSTISHPCEYWNTYSIWSYLTYIWFHKSVLKIVSNTYFKKKLHPILAKWWCSDIHLSSSPHVHLPASSFDETGIYIAGFSWFIVYIFYNTNCRQRHFLNISSMFWKLVLKTRSDFSYVFNFSDSSVKFSNI